MSAENDTKDRILDAAERLFAERGVGGTSLRAVTTEAGANVAAVHYHFGSKDDLVRALAMRRAGPVNRERLKLLDAVEASDPGDLEAILDAFFRPPVSLLLEDGREAVPSFLFQEPVERVAPVVAEVMGEVARRFVAALGCTLPHLSPDELVDRWQLVVGALIHVISNRSTHAPLAAPRRPLDETLRRLVVPLAAALRAAPAEDRP